MITECDAPDCSCHTIRERQAAGETVKSWADMTTEERQQSELEKHGPLPEIGDWYIWGENVSYPEYAAELVQVTKITWNGDEWYVWATGNRVTNFRTFTVEPREYFNDLNHWNEMTRKLSPEELCLD